MQEAIHGLWRVILDPETRKPVFRSAEHMREYCTDGVITAFVILYNAFAGECDPNTKELPPEQLDDFISELKKTPEQIHLRVLNLGIAWQLLRTLAAPPKT